MQKITLRERLQRYLKNHKGWVASGDLQRLVLQHTTYTPQTTGRELRHLQEEGVLEVEYRHKNHAYYRYIPDESRNAVPSTDTLIKWFDDLPDKPTR